MLLLFIHVNSPLHIFKDARTHTRAHTHTHVFNYLSMKIFLYKYIQGSQNTHTHPTYIFYPGRFFSTYIQKGSKNTYTHTYIYLIFIHRDFSLYIFKEARTHMHTHTCTHLLIYYLPSLFFIYF